MHNHSRFTARMLKNSIWRLPLENVTLLCIRTIMRMELEFFNISRSPETTYPNLCPKAQHIYQFDC